uniref:RING-type E3 ubiquitin transferase n=1 Tax=Parascaris univalens TaxID=6257 RepID=A0A914ZGV4_PARUN
MASLMNGDDVNFGDVIVIGVDSEAAEMSDASSISSNPRRHARRIFLDDTSYSDDAGDVSDENAPTMPNDAQRRAVLSSGGEEDAEPLSRKRRKKDGKVGDNTLVAEDDEGNCCSICFEEYTNAGAHRLVCLKCGHVFGQCCIERWIRTEKNAKCPQCKMRARIGDMRLIFARTVKMIDTTELEELRESNKAYKIENDRLRLEVVQLKIKLKKAEEEASTSRSANSALIMAPKTFHEFSLSVGRSIVLSTQPGSRSVHDDGNMFVVTCRIDNDIFKPYGLKVVTREGRVTAAMPVHTKRPRCCRVSPFDCRLVLSTGEDRTLCITEFGEVKQIRHQMELPANGWSCCWLSDNEVLVGLVNGRVLKFDVTQPTAIPVDITGGSGRMPVIYVHALTSVYAVIVVSLKQCTLYYRQQPHILVSDGGSINSFTYDSMSDSFVVSFAPDDRHLTTRHALYRLVLDEENVEVTYVRDYNSRSTKQTRMISCAFWNTPSGHISAVIDEAHSQLVVIDWTHRRNEVIRRIDDEIVAVKEI